MAETVAALTVWQPWATLIAEGAKLYEFRSYRISQRFWGKRLAIHAGARKISEAEVRALLVKLHSPSWRETGMVRSAAIQILEKVKAAPKTFPLSSILCTALVGEPLTPAEIARRMGIDLVEDSDRTEHHNFGWPLSDVQRLQPIVPAKGQQGIWSIALDVGATPCP